MPSLLPLRSPNGASGNKIKIWFIKLGKPDQNAYIERFNRSYREEVLNAYLFESLSQVREITENWLCEYNEERPHERLGSVPPLTFMPRPTESPESTSKLCA